MAGSLTSSEPVSRKPSQATALGRLLTPEGVSTLADAQGGLVTREQSRRLGVDRRAVGHRLAFGLWKEIMGCLWPSTDAPPTEGRDAAELAAWAIHLRGGSRGAITSGRAALTLMGVTLPELGSAPAICLVPVTTRCRIPDVSVIRPPPTAATSLIFEGGRRIRRPLDAFLDTLPLLPKGLAREWIDAAMQQRLCKVEDLERHVMNRRVRGRSGSTLLGECLARFQAGTQSELERMTARLLRRHRIDGWTPNLQVVLKRGGERKVQLDFGHPTLKIGLELDGYAHHVSGRAFARDRQRQNAILADGWHLLRYTYAHIRDEAPRVVKEILAAMRDRTP